jgi:hypothetical protein
MTPETIVAALSAIRMPDVFNPYLHTCPVHDRPDAAATRRTNLTVFLRAARSLKIETLWMGRDLGYRGGRRTGLALTDERHLPVFASLYGGSSVAQATMGPAIAERTAAEIWSAISELAAPPFLWNVFPFHPYESGEPFTNRRFTNKELMLVHATNQALIDWLGIKRIVAIGQDAAQYSLAFGVDVVTVRHPSYGGVTDFRQGIQALYPPRQRSRQSEQVVLF